MTRDRLDGLAAEMLKRGWTITRGAGALLVRCSVVRPRVTAQVIDTRNERYLPSLFLVHPTIDGQQLDEQRVHSVQTVCDYLSSLTIEKRRK